jgi:hypothetical protein
VRNRVPRSSAAVAAATSVVASSLAPLPLPADPVFGGGRPSGRGASAAAATAGAGMFRV